MTFNPHKYYAEIRNFAIVLHPLTTFDLYKHCTKIKNCLQLFQVADFAITFDVDK